MSSAEPCGGERKTGLRRVAAWAESRHRGVPRQLLTRWTRIFLGAQGRYLARVANPAAAVTIARLMSACMRRRAPDRFDGVEISDPSASVATRHAPAMQMIFRTRSLASIPAGACTTRRGADPRAAAPATMRRFRSGRRAAEAVAWPPRTGGNIRMNSPAGSASAFDRARALRRRNSGLRRADLGAGRLGQAQSST